ncbi:MAG: hypothetical protein Q9227_008335 [Pyrenula ochraceoflavens]
MPSLDPSTSIKLSIDLEQFSAETLGPYNYAPHLSSRNSLHERPQSWIQREDSEMDCVLEAPRREHSNRSHHSAAGPYQTNFNNASLQLCQNRAQDPEMRNVDAGSPYPGGDPSQDGLSPPKRISHRNSLSEEFARLCTIKEGAQKRFLRKKLLLKHFPSDPRALSLRQNNLPIRSVRTKRIMKNGSLIPSSVSPSSPSKTLDLPGPELKSEPISTCARQEQDLALQDYYHQLQFLEESNRARLMFPNIEDLPSREQDILRSIAVGTSVPAFTPDSQLWRSRLEPLACWETQWQSNAKDDPGQNGPETTGNSRPEDSLKHPATGTHQHLFTNQTARYQTRLTRSMQSSKQQARPFSNTRSIPPAQYTLPTTYIWQQRFRDVRSALLQHAQQEAGQPIPPGVVGAVDARARELADEASRAWMEQNAKSGMEECSN